VSLLEGIAPGEDADRRGDCRRDCLRLFDKAVDIYATTKNLTMLAKLRTMLEKRFVSESALVCGVC
jgi:hypothetical protein